MHSSYFHLQMQSYSKALCAVVSAVLLESSSSKMQVPNWGRSCSALWLLQGLYSLLGKVARCAC